MFAFVTLGVSVGARGGSSWVGVVCPIAGLLAGCVVYPEVGWFRLFTSLIDLIVLKPGVQQNVV